MERIKKIPKRIAYLLLGGVLGTGTAYAQSQPAAAQGEQPSNRLGAQHKPAGDLPGPIDSLSDLQDTGKIIFKLADTNNDNQISKKEAADFGNLAVGGFFFRADANGDGKISPEEARAARESLLRQKPMLRMVLERTKREGAAGSAGANPLRSLADLLDANHDKQLQASEVRQTVTTTVDSLFQVADTNRDNQMSPTEINAAIIGMARSAAKSAMQAADTDRDGALSLAEFDKAITGPSHVVFQVIDTNGDGKISEAEAQAAARIVYSQLKMLNVPEPANSASNLIGSGVKPEQAAPVPDFGTVRPRGAGNAQPATPNREVPR